MAKSTKTNIFYILKNVGTVSEKGDILGDDPMEDKVYTKKLVIDKTYNFKNGSDTVNVMSISLTCKNEDFSDATPNKVRFNLKNINGSWVNIFMHEAPKELIDFIYLNII